MCVYDVHFFSQFTHTAAASSVTAGTERQIIKDYEYTAITFSLSYPVIHLSSIGGV